MPRSNYVCFEIKKDSKISKNVTNNKKTLAIRFPSHPLTKKLLKKLSYPLAAPSANISTKISPISREDVIEEFGKKDKAAVEEGSNISTKPSSSRFVVLDQYSRNTSTYTFHPSGQYE